MKKWIISLPLIATTIIPVHAASPDASTDSFYFVAMDQPVRDNANVLKKAFSKLGHIRPAFAIVNGIKSGFGMLQRRTVYRKKKPCQ